MTLLPPDEVDAALARRSSGWTRDGDELVTVRTGPDFAAAMTFVVAVAALAEEADHHPDIDIRWNTVTLRLTTHSAGGLTGKDLDLAAAVDGIRPGVD